MQHRVFLHVGLPKSGTTFLQAVLLRNKAQLAEAGMLFPGEGGWKDQVRAVRDIREMKHARFNHRKLVPGSWDRLVEEIQAFSGDAVVSMEWLSRAEPEQVEKILETLAPREVHVIFTARDLARVMPASWQESVVNRYEWSWPEFLQEISDEAVPRFERRFWRMHDLLPLMARWSPPIPADRMHVVTVPPPGSAADALWERFGGVLGVSDVALNTSGVKRNDGLGLAATEVMRRLNRRSRDLGISNGDHKLFLSHQLAKRGLGEASDRALRPRIPVSMHPWITAVAEETITGLRASGVDIVGDLDDLVPDLSGHLEPLSDPDDGAMLEVALEAAIRMTEQRAKASAQAEKVEAGLRKELKVAERRYHRLERRHLAQENTWNTRPMRSALRVYARRSPLAVRLVRRIRRALAR